MIPETKHRLYAAIQAVFLYVRVMECGIHTCLRLYFCNGHRRNVIRNRCLYLQAAALLLTDGIIAENGTEKAFPRHKKDTRMRYTINR